MSGLIERFWRPQPKDVPGGLINQGRYFEGVNAIGAAAASLSVDSGICPPNTLRIITQISFGATPGAAQTVTNVTFAWVFAINFASTYQARFQPQLALGAAVGYVHHETLGEGIWLRPGELIRVVANFNAGAAVNNLTANLWGYDFPVGNTL